MPRASRCSAGPTVAAQDVGGFGVGERRELADGFDAEPVQFLLGDRSDAPQPPHRQPVEQRAFLVAADHPDAVGLGQAGGDLGDLLARAGADGRDETGLVAHRGPQVLAEQFHVFGCGAGEFGRLAERLVERELFEHGHHGAHGVEDPSAGHAVDHAARRQHHRARADQPAGLMHGHRRAGAVGAGLVAGAGDDAAAAEAADQDRPSAQGGAGQLLDGREERIHVQMQDPTDPGRCYCSEALDVAPRGDRRQRATIRDPKSGDRAEAQRQVCIASSMKTARRATRCVADQHAARRTMSHAHGRRPTDNQGRADEIDELHTGVDDPRTPREHGGGGHDEGDCDPRRTRGCGHVDRDSTILDAIGLASYAWG